MKLEVSPISETKLVPARRPPVKNSLWRRLLKQWDLQLMVLPSILLIIVFSYIPIWGLLTAFQEYDITQGLLGSPWVGLYQFQMFFSDPEFGLVLRNTIVISLLKLAFCFTAPILLALMLNEVNNGPFKRIIQTISYLPHFMSWVIVAGLVFSALSVDNGTVNSILLQFHLIKEPINWLSTPQYFWGILISANVWKEVGFGAIIYMAAIAGIDPNLYEAAAMDGAGRIQRICYIILPSIAPVITIMLILSIGQILSAGFEDILLLTNSGNNAVVANVSDVIDTYVYRVGLLDSRYSYATAVGLFKSLANIALLLIANFVARLLGRESLW